MFFILSKILDFLISPVIWIIFFLLFSILTKNPKRKKIALITSFSMLLFFSNSFIIDEFMRAWEIKAVKKEEIKEPYDYGIILGGMISFDSEYDRVNFVRSVDRLMQTLELYKLNKIKKILITSGSGSLKEPGMKEAEILKKYLVNIGAPDEDILTESVSRNTHENAVFTAKLLTGKNKKPACLPARYLLITSASHMRRSLGCFRKAGIIADPYVTDRYAGHRKFYPDHLLLPNVQALEAWNVFLHELAGCAVYKICGYM
ncbi:MAG: YdcF family protein [Bacteroidia bacterium]|nr:YdcF family protein [Bacteroidia bacterium]